MGLYHKGLFTLVVKGTTKDWEGAGSIPSLAAMQFILPPRVSSTRRAGPVCQLGRGRGTRVSARLGAWDPRVRSDRRVGPACQVGPARGTRVSARPGAWDPRVSSDRRVGPVCQVGLTKFKCMTDGSYTPRKKNGSYTPHKKN
jgi:hypothetical protein